MSDDEYALRDARIRALIDTAYDRGRVTMLNDCVDALYQYLVLGEEKLGYLPGTPQRATICTCLAKLRELKS